IFARVASEPGDFTVVEIPGIDQVPGRIMYDQTIHGKRIFIGTVARVPVEKMSYYFGLPLVRPLVDLRKGRLDVGAGLLARERLGDAGRRGGRADALAERAALDDPLPPAVGGRAAPRPRGRRR